MLAFHSHMRPVPRSSLLKLPSQARSVETVHAILDAAGRVLVEEGAVAFTTNRVAEVAGISPGSLYQYFANGDMILAGIVERGLLEAEETLRAALKVAHDAPLEDVVRRALNVVLAQLEPRSSVIAELLEAAPLLAKNGITNILETRLMDVVRDFLVREPTKYRVRSDSAALYVAVNGVVFVLLKWLAERPPHVSRERLVDAVIEIAKGVIASAGEEQGRGGRRGR